MRKPADLIEAQVTVNEFVDEIRRLGGTVTRRPEAPDTIVLKTSRGRTMIWGRHGSLIAMTRQDKLHHLRALGLID